MCEPYINGATVVVVEHADQHPASLLAELAHVAVNQSALELNGRNLPASVSVHGQEPLSDLVLISSSQVVHFRTFRTLIVNRSLLGLLFTLS